LINIRPSKLAVQNLPSVHAHLRFAAGSLIRSFVVASNLLESGIFRCLVANALCVVDSELMLSCVRMLDQRVAFALIACAMVLRVLIPAGWMPTTGADGMIRISVCTGMGAETAWIDRDGKIHKEAPTSGHHDPQPCGFGVLGLGLNETHALGVALPVVMADVLALVAKQTLSIGHGLAAPLPPSTGPPSLI
jgi:hypothetical protein